MPEKCWSHIPGKLSRLWGNGHFLPLAFIALALIIQAFLFITGRVLLDQDDCYLGIQGLDIINGARPVLFPAQNYMGCLEAYFHVIFRLLLGASIPLTLKTQAAVQTLIFLLTFYLFIRRFFDRSIVLISLLLLCIPPNFPALWYGRIKGYTPPLILGNGILYLIFLLDEKESSGKGSYLYFLLGLLVGAAWWANPISIYYAAFVFILSILSPRLRDALWKEGFRFPGMFVNGFALILLAILEFRTIFKTEHIAFFQMLVQGRHLVWMGLILFVIISIMIRVWKPQTGMSLFLLCMGGILGSLPLLFVYWNTPVEHIRHGAGTLYIFFHNIILTPPFVFPIMAGLTDLTADPDILLFSPVIVVLAGLLYAGIIYYTIRIWFHAGRNHRKIILLGFVMLLIFWGQKIYVWYQSRYLLPFYIPLFVMMAYFFRDLNRGFRHLGTVLLSLLLIVHIWGIVGLPSNKILMPSGLFSHEKNILEYCRKNRFEKVYITLNDDEAVRMTYYADKKISFQNLFGYSDRLESYETRYRALGGYVLIVGKDTKFAFPPMKQPDAEIDGFNIFQDLSKEQFLNLCDSVAKARNDDIKRIYGNVP